MQEIVHVEDVVPILEYVYWGPAKLEVLVGRRRSDVESVEEIPHLHVLRQWDDHVSVNIYYQHGVDLEASSGTSDVLTIPNSITT